MQLLLSRGSNKKAEDVWKKTPYDYAVSAGHSPDGSIMKLLSPGTRKATEEEDTAALQGS